MRKIFFLFIFGLFLIGCNNPFQNNTRSIKCNDPDAISLAEDIINNDLFNDEIKKNATSKFKIDTKNIVWWDSKRVGRNLCMAKISAKVYKTDDFNNFLTNLIKGYTAYGIHYDDKTKELKGWIYYQTYPVMNSKDGTFYVEILPKNEIKEW